MLLFNSHYHYRTEYRSYYAIDRLISNKVSSELTKKGREFVSSNGLTETKGDIGDDHL